MSYSNAMQKYTALACIGAALLIVCALVELSRGEYIFAGCWGGTGVLLLGAVFVLTIKRREAIARYVNKALETNENISEDSLTSVPMAMVISSIDGSVEWYNDSFSAIFEGNKLPSEILDDCIPKLKWSEVLKHPTGKPFETVIGGKSYNVKWRMLKNKIEGNKLGDHFSVIFFLSDITDIKQLKTNYQNEKTDIAIISVDNYEEFAQKADDDMLERASSRIRSEISGWAKEQNAVLKKIDRDRYFMAFEHRYLKSCIDKKFPVVEAVRKVSEDVKFPLSVSVGIGTGGNIAENEASARNALELALGRGGGQVCVKDDKQFMFYGGNNGEYERSSRVKARAVAVALRDFIKSSDNVIFMGHRGADYDCFGAAVGLQRAVRELGKTPYIVHERISPAVDIMYNALKEIPEYNGMFLDEEEILEEVTPDTLLVVLDTHRPSMLPCSKLLERVNKVVLIDHHRRSTEFIGECSLTYHEPYASSTCEMATELVEYMGISGAVTKLEAQCLYTGIIMDTKNFMLKTGARTFEAASYLRKLGLDTVAVRRMFCTTKDDYRLKAEIVESALMITENVAIGRTDSSDDNIRMVSSQAADEMLNLNNVAASVVVYPADGGTGFSARSLGSINVQLIMEKLGGGGHATVSGAYIKNIDVDEGVKRATVAIRSYFADLRNK